MASTISVGETRARPTVTAWWLDAAKLLSPLFQLGLVLLLIYHYQLESLTFFNIAALAVVGFAIHALLPLAYRLHFFVLLSFVGIGVAFGLQDGAWLVAVGLVLIGICHLPVRLGVRVALLAGMGIALAVSRGGLLPAPWSLSVWPILASMFMFRLAVYLYALQYDRIPVSPSRTLAYFFMLPNVCFPLYPVVDYSTFSRTYYDRDAHQIYEQGVQWIIRGLVHLLLYRFIYLNLTKDPAELANLGDVVQFMLSTFLLYLRISGSFHLIVGMLHLFGFRLPETHRLYYLASSFTDFWRRINIYWKDFMMKLVYYPSFFRLRRWGDRTALVGATVIVFLATWLLHSYQWFWLRGGFPLTLQDGLFWGLLGTFVVVNALREIKRGRKRTLTQQQGWNAGLAVRTTLMFWGMTILWSLWSAESVGEWLGMWAAAAHVDTRGLLLIAGVTAGFLFAGGRAWVAPSLDSSTPRRFYARPAVQGAALLLGLLFVGQPRVYAHTHYPSFASAVASLRSSTLNARDANLQHKGYYENLDNPSRISSQLWDVSSKKPADWVVLKASEVYRTRSDFLLGDLHPSKQIIYQSQPFSTNRWGMRDQDYSLAKPPGTYRIALLGPSHVMGSGIADGESFEAVLEDRLNSEATGRTRYEVLNFGVGGYSLLQQMALLDERVWDFQPDMVIITMPGRPKLMHDLRDHLIHVSAANIEIPYPELQSLLSEGGVEEVRPNRAYLAVKRPILLVARKLGISRNIFRLEAEKRIRAISDEIVEWSLRRIAQETQTRGVVPVLLGFDIVSFGESDGVPAGRIAEEAGFLVFDLFDVYHGHDPSELRIAEWDYHPNALANRLIADRLYAEIRRRDAELGLGLSGEVMGTNPN